MRKAVFACATNNFYTLWVHVMYINIPIINKILNLSLIERD